MKITIKDAKGNDVNFFVNEEILQMETDWRELTTEEFYEKYPNSKPIHPAAKVTLDEKDKI